MARFKPGDRIRCIIPQSGIEDGVVLRIDKGRYYIKVPCGIASIPIRDSIEDNYEIVTD